MDRLDADYIRAKIIAVIEISTHLIGTESVISEMADVGYDNICHEVISDLNRFFDSLEETKK